MELGFRIFGIPVRVSLWFFLIVFLLGGDHVRSSPVLAVAWIAIAFVGVLCHELGHALVVRAFKGEPAILFHGMGGLTSWRQRAPISPARHIVIAAAGPAVGIVLGFPLFVAWVAVRSSAGLLPELLYLGWFVNLLWGLLNLLPVLPMDGGKIMASIFEMVAKGRGVKAARIASLVLAVAGIGLSLLGSQVYLAVLFALFAFSNYQAIQAERIERLAAAEAAAARDIGMTGESATRDR